MSRWTGSYLNGSRRKNKLNQTNSIKVKSHQQNRKASHDAALSGRHFALQENHKGLLL